MCFFFPFIFTRKTPLAKIYFKSLNELIITFLLPSNIPFRFLQYNRLERVKKEDFKSLILLEWL